MPYSSNSFVANSMTKALQDKILAKTWLNTSETGYELYVSNQGNNTTGDGSQTNPFATISGAVSYILNRIAQRANTTININCLTDIDESAQLLSLERFTGKIAVNANNHEVKLGSLSVADCEVQCTGVTFVGRSTTRAVAAKVGATITLNNCIFDISSGVFAAIGASNGGYVYALGNTTFTANVTYGLAMTELLSIVRLDGTISIASTTSPRGSALLVCRRGGLMYIPNSAALSGSWNGPAYALSSGGQLHLDGRGDSFIPGSAGSMDDNSILS